MSADQIQIEDLIVHVVRKRIKNIYLRIYPDCRILVTASWFISDARIHRFLIQKKSWIQNKLNKFKSVPKRSSRQMVSGETHYFLGEPHELHLIEKSASPLPFCDKAAKKLYIPIANSEKLKATLDFWYREQFEKIMPSLIKKWEAIVDVKVTGWKIKKMNTRWGSCNITGKRISLNLALILKPLSCIEYVLVHELVHLHERLHNRRFWMLMDTFMPDWRDHDRLLKTNLLE